MRIILCVVAALAALIVAPTSVFAQLIMSGPEGEAQSRKMAEEYLKQKARDKAECERITELFQPWLWQPVVVNQGPPFYRPSTAADWTFFATEWPSIGSTLTVGDLVRLYGSSGPMPFASSGSLYRDLILGPGFAMTSAHQMPDSVSVPSSSGGSFFIDNDNEIAIRLALHRKEVKLEIAENILLVWLVTAPFVLLLATYKRAKKGVANIVLGIWLGVALVGVFLL